MSNTPNLQLPLVAASQAQKHVTVNETFVKIDALLQLAVINQTTANPPSGASDGDRYIIGSGATGAWVGRDLNIAYWDSGSWTIIPPIAGWVAWDVDTARLVVWDGSNWVDIANILTPDQVNILGVGGATANTTDKLIVESEGVLFSRGVDDLFVKLNKEASTDTASLFFQTNFSTRAEFGISGSDDFSIKTSPDGSTFKTAIEIPVASGHAKFIEPPEAPQYSRTALPPSGTSAQFIYVYDATGGAGMAYSDGGGWKMFRDDAAP